MGELSRTMGIFLVWLIKNYVEWADFFCRGSSVLGKSWVLDQVFNILLAEGPGVARGKKKLEFFFLKRKILKQKKIGFFILKHPAGTPVSTQKLSPFGPAVWPAIGDIYKYTNVLFYYIDWVVSLFVCMYVFHKSQNSVHPIGQNFFVRASQNVDFKIKSSENPP